MTLSFRFSGFADLPKRAGTSPVKKLVLGSAQFGLDYGISNAAGQVGGDHVLEILTTAAAAGLDLVDTAALYADAEIVLRRAGANSAGFRFVTKTRRLAEGGALAVAEGVSRSLDRLGVECLYGLLVHSAADLQGSQGDGLWRELRLLKEKGRTERIGFSAYVSDGPAALARRFGPDIVQLPVSLLDQRLIRCGDIDALGSAGVEVHARSIFLQGLALMAPIDIPAPLAAARPAVERMRQVLREAGLTPLEACVAFALGISGVSRTVVGVTLARELEEILVAAESGGADLDWQGLAINDEAVLDPARWSV